MIASGSQRLSLLFPWLAGPLIFGLLSLTLGQDANWDLRNYHLYNPYAFLHQRHEYDVVPAQVANFYNPLLFLPYYFVVIGLPPLVTSFLLGAIQGLNFPLLMGIARAAVAGEREHPWGLFFLLALLGLLGAGNLSELGTMFADNVVSLLVLAGIWLLLARFRPLTAPGGGALRLAAAAGLLFGAAAGLKQPAAIFAVGWCAAMLFLPVPLKRRVGLAFVFGLGVLGGIAATGGYWMYELWRLYGNPLFPYFNQFFASPMGSLANYRDLRFVPETWLESLFFPFLIVWEPHRTAEIFFRDLRLPLFALLLPLAGSVALFRRLRAGQPRVEPAGSPDQLALKRLFLLAGALIAYAVWLRLFAIYRYIVPLEMLAPLGIWLLLASLPVRRATRNGLAVCCAVLLLATQHPGNWGRVSWGDDFFGFTAPPLADPERTMVLMTGVAPLAYVIPFFPAPVRFVRIQSYFTGPSATPNGFDLRMRELVAAHRGPLHVLLCAAERETTDAALSAYGLTVSAGGCRELSPHIEEFLHTPLLFCGVERLESSAAGDENR